MLTPLNKLSPYLLAIAISFVVYYKVGIFAANKERDHYKAQVEQQNIAILEWKRVGDTQRQKMAEAAKKAADEYAINDKLTKRLAAREEGKTCEEAIGYMGRDMLEMQKLYKK